MALSSWDTFAVNIKCKSINGTFKSPKGINVEIYKNWIYIRDDDGYGKDSHFTQPTVASIQHGDITYKDVCILATRGPQNGVYLACWSYMADDNNRQKVEGMVGCGVYGFDNDNWIGVTRDSITFLIGWLKQNNDIVPLEIANMLINKDNVKRFNQGDAFFAAITARDTPSTAVEDAKEPVIKEIIDKISNACD